MTPFSYHLYLTGDVHLGSGAGSPGIVDQYVVRDADGFAEFPSRTIKGIVRDSCARLMQQLGLLGGGRACRGHVGQWQSPEYGRVPPQEFCCFVDPARTCVLCSLFGSPWTAARLWFSPARYAKSFRALAKDLGNELGDPQEFAAGLDAADSPHTAIDPWTRSAAKGSFFHFETMRAGGAGPNCVEGQFALQGSMDGAQPAVDESEILGWAFAAILFTRRIGGGRRRGWGRCRFLIPAQTNVPRTDDVISKWIENVHATSRGDE